MKMMLIPTLTISYLTGKEKLMPKTHFSLNFTMTNTKKKRWTDYTKVRTYDLELRHVYTMNETHKFTFGGGYRIARDDINNSDVTRFIPERTQRDTFRLFGQDEISLIQNELTLILGTKYERNDHTGTEWQPSGKLIWTPSEEHTLWGSIARSVRTPSRADEDFQNRIRFAFVGGPELTLVGGPQS